MEVRRIRKLLGCIKRADEEHGMIRPHDKILVGVSGGKDSIVLLKALSLYRFYAGKPFTLMAATLTLGIDQSNLSATAALCRELNIPYIIKPTRIGPIVFDERKEQNPCSLCSRMRHGILNRLAAEMGADAVAYGHHREDVLETLTLSLFNEARIHTFKPVTNLTRANLRLIRPMIYASEASIAALAKRLELPVIKNPCPAGGNTQRARMKEMWNELARRQPGAREMALAALRNRDAYGLW